MVATCPTVLWKSVFSYTCDWFQVQTLIWFFIKGQLVACDMDLSRSQASTSVMGSTSDSQLLTQEIIEFLYAVSQLMYGPTTTLY